MISVRDVNDDGTFGDWMSVPTAHEVTNGDSGLAVNPTGGAHLLIGAAFADDGTAVPLGNTSGAAGNIRQVLPVQRRDQPRRNPQGRRHHRGHRQRDVRMTW